MAKAEYRSSIRSKNLIKKALVKLMHDKDLAKITVSDIIREADISRGTFYAHFTDINSVIEQIENEEVKKLLAFVDTFKGAELKNPTTVFLRTLCDYLSQDMEYYRMFTQTNILHNFLHRLINIFYEETVQKIIEKDSLITQVDADVYLTYTSAGASMVIIAWLNGDIKGTPKEVADRLAKLVDNSKTFKRA